MSYRILHYIRSMIQSGIDVYFSAAAGNNERALRIALYEVHLFYVLNFHVYSATRLYRRRLHALSHFCDLMHYVGAVPVGEYHEGQPLPLHVPLELRHLLGANFPLRIDHKDGPVVLSLEASPVVGGGGGEGDGKGERGSYRYLNGLGTVMRETKLNKSREAGGGVRETTFHTHEKYFYL